MMATTLGGTNKQCLCDVSGVPMEVTHVPGATKRLRKAVGRYQATFHTPLEQLPAFVATLLGAAEALRSASVTIEQVVFEPKNLHALLPTVGLEAIRRDTVITTVGHHTSDQLLRAALADWVDFFLVPVPQQYVLYADHDEYLTLFAATKSVVSSVRSVVRSAGFEQVSGYQRNW